MVKTLNLMAKSLGYNLKTLVYFEILYRVIGVILVYPLVSRLFYLSIDISPFVYITNKDLIGFLLNPMTILLFMLILLVVSIYFFIEILFLQVLFEMGLKEIQLKFRFLIELGFEQIKTLFRMVPFYLWIPTLSFVYLTLFISVYGFASTIELPILINQLRADTYINRLIIGFSIVVFILFMETMLFLPLYGFEKKRFKVLRKQNRALLKGSRFRNMAEFVMINFVMNFILYALYLLIILILGWLIQLTRGEGYVVPTLFTLIYAIYTLIGFLSTLFFIPINVAFITAVYQRDNPSLEISNTIDFYTMKPLVKHSKWTSRVAILVIVVLIGLNIGTVYQILGADRTPLEILNRSVVIAHRGASMDAPENTLEAIELAIEQGADAVEIDVRLSKDGIPFLFHDYTVNRTTNLKTRQSVESFTLAELQALDAGSWFGEDFAGAKIPSLVEVLELIQGRTQLYLEIKGTTTGIEYLIMALLKDYEMIDSTTIMSFSESQLERIKAIDETITTMLLIPVFVGSISGVVNLEYIDTFGLRFDMIKANPEYIELIHKSEKKAYVWTLNKSSDITYAVNVDVDGIITDHPLLAIELVYEKITPTLLQDLIRRLFNKQ